MPWSCPCPCPCPSGAHPIERWPLYPHPGWMARPDPICLHPGPMSKASVQPLPFAPDRNAWSWAERSELGQHGTADILHRVPTSAEEDGVQLPKRLRLALPLLLHENATLQIDDLPAQTQGLLPAQTLARVLPR